MNASGGRECSLLRCRLCVCACVPGKQIGCSRFLFSERCYSETTLPSRIVCSSTLAECFLVCVKILSIQEYSTISFFVWYTSDSFGDPFWFCFTLGLVVGGKLKRFQHRLGGPTPLGMNQLFRCQGRRIHR